MNRQAEAGPTLAAGDPAIIVSTVESQQGCGAPGNDAHRQDAVLAPFAGQILETVETPVLVLDLAGSIVRFNAACRKLTGYSAEDAIGRKVWDFLIVPEETAAVKDVFTRTRASAIPTHFTNYWLTRSKERRLLRWSNTVLRHPSDSTGYILATGVDITETRQSAQRLADREAFLHSVIETAPTAIITIGTNGVIRSFSPSAEKLLGHKATDVIGRNIRVLMPSPYCAEHDRYIKRYLETGETRIIGHKRRMLALHKNGMALPVALSIGEFAQHGERLFVGFMEDITAEEEAKRRLNDIQEELQQVSRVSVVGEMSAAIAHELNQPLTAAASFAGAAEMILDRQEHGQSTAVRDNLRRSIGEIHRAGQLLRRIRNFLTSGRPEKSPHNVNDVVREAVALTFLSTHRDSATYRLDLANRVPPVPLDRIQIQQVIVNLVRNAIEALKDSPQKEVSLQTLATDKYVEIRVADTGDGVHENLKERMFQPFVSGRKNGMGLGLSICRTIVEGHGGEIDAWPNTPHGTVFAFRLPLKV